MKQRSIVFRGIRKSRIPVSDLRRYYCHYRLKNIYKIEIDVRKRIIYSSDEFDAKQLKYINFLRKQQYVVQTKLKI